MLKKLLTIKHWHLFGLFIVIIIFDSCFTLVSDQTGLILSMLLFILLLFGWFWAIAIYLHPKLPPSTNYNLNIFKVFLLIPVVYITIIAILYGRISFGTNDENLNSIAAIIVPLHFFSMFCIFWCMAFVAKSLKTVELQRKVTFSDYAGEFFLLWFFPIGVWFIQPRLNKIMTNNIDSNISN